VGRAAAAQTPKPGGTLISAQATEATGLDPQLVPALSRSRRSPLMYSQLVRFDESMTPRPELAESWETSKDGLTWTFKLREGVKFHDGQEMTSADVKFTFDRLFEKSPGKSDFIAVDRVEPAGKYAVKFITKEPFAGMLAALGGFWGFIISEAGIKKHGDLNKAALGTGPFMLADWKVEQQLVLKKHPGFFKKGQPYVDELIVRTIPDEANIVAALRTGQIQHAFIEDNKNFNLLKDEKSLTGYRSSRLGYDYLNITATRGPLKDVRVRQAISWAVDRSQVLRVAAAGFGRLTAPATAPMRQWQLPEEAWMKYYKPDVEKAKKLMAEAGQSGGFTVKCMVIPTFPTMVSGAPVIANQLKRIGITMEIENVEYAIWIKRWLAHDFDMTMNTTPGYADPDTAFFRALHSTKGQNWNSWSVPELDALLEEGRRTMDQKKRKEIYDRVQIMILENVPHLWLFSADTIDFTQANVKGFKQHPTTLLYGLDSAWLDKT
jgi:peptide/nickel transport system substrate-binding protein